MLTRMNTMITNKEMFNTNLLKVESDSMGEWNGNETLAAEKFEKIQRALFNACPDDYDDEKIIDLFQDAWDYWGSTENLLTISDNQIDEYVNESI